MEFVRNALDWLWRSSGDILTNLIAAAIGGTLVWLRVSGRRTVIRYRARKFWRSLATEQATLVLADHDRSYVDSWEPSGLVGLEDVRAAMLIHSGLQELGSPVSLRDDNDFGREHWNRNLILIGGPDVNRVAAELFQMDAVEGQLTIVFPGWRSHVVSLYDKTNDAYLDPRRQDGRIVVDFGIITRMPNPLSERPTEILHIAGCFGFGTMGAALALHRKEFRQHPVIRARKPFQALVEVRVVDGTPHFGRLVTVRAMSSESVNSG